MILVSAILVFANQEDRDRAVEISTPIQLATRVDEPGCESYCFAADPSVPTQIQVYENWADGPALAAHFKHKNYEDMVAALGGCGILESRNQMYLVEKHEPVYGPNGERREEFFTD